MVTLYDKTPVISRRELFRRGSAAGVGALLVISGSAVLSPRHAWGMETTALKPETMATLIQMARDIYPHESPTNTTPSPSRAMTRTQPRMWRTGT